MTFTKKIIFSVSLISFIFSLGGCATTYHRGDGVVIDVKKIKDKDFKPHQITHAGAKVGGSVGTVGGAAAGGFFGLTGGLIGGASSIGLIATTLGGAGIGAVIVGLAGSAVGGGIGYMADITTPNTGLYQFKVKPYNEKEVLTITQYSAPIMANTRVHILEENETLIIKKN